MLKVHLERGKTILFLLAAVSALVSVGKGALRPNAANPPAVSLNLSTPIYANQATLATFSIANPNAGAALTGVSMTATLSSDLVVATPNNFSGSCGGGTIAVASGSSSISVSGATLQPGAGCSFHLSVVAATVGVKTISATVAATGIGSGNTATASLTVNQPLPRLSYVVPNNVVVLNGITPITFTLTNPYAGAPTTAGALDFTMNLPGIIAVGTPNGLTGSCGGGTLTAVAASSSINLAGAVLQGGASCSFSVNLTGLAAGEDTMSAFLKGPVGQGGPVSVAAPSQVALVLDGTVIPLNGVAQLGILLKNLSTSSSTLPGELDFLINLPGGLVVTNPSGSSQGCMGGSITAVSGASTITLSNNKLPAKSTCLLTVALTGTSAGAKPIKAELASGSSASVTLNVLSQSPVPPPVLTKSFSPASIPPGGNTTLQFTVANHNSTPLSGIGFFDQLAGPFKLATPTGLTGSCGNGTITAGPDLSGGRGVRLSGGTIAANSSCTFSVNLVVGTAGTIVNGGSNPNVIPLTNTTGPITSAESGMGTTATASMELAIPPHPTVQLTTDATKIPLNGTAQLGITIAYPATSGRSSPGDFDFAIQLPGGLTVATPNGSTGGCLGGTVTAASGSSAITFSNTILPAKTSCYVAIDLTGTSPGQKLFSASLPDGSASAAELTVGSQSAVPPPILTKTFMPASVPRGGATTLQFTVQNNNNTPLTDIGFFDPVIGAFQVATPDGLTGSCGNGVITAGLDATGWRGVRLSGGNLAANSSCTFSVKVVVKTAGIPPPDIPLSNTTGPITAAESGMGGTASANVVETAGGGSADPPTMATSFVPSAIPVGATTSLTFTLINSNSTTLTSVGFTDNLPAGVTASGGMATFCGGTLITVAPGSISFVGATIASNSQCRFSVTVTGAVAGVYTNTTSQVVSKEGGSGATASAQLTVKGPGATQPPTQGNPPTGTGSAGAGGLGSGGAGSGSGGGSSGSKNNPTVEYCSLPGADPLKCACQQRFMVVLQVVTTSSVNMGAAITENSSRSLNNGQGIRVPIVLHDDGTFEGFGRGVDAGSAAARSGPDTGNSQFAREVVVEASGIVRPGDCSTKPCKPDTMYLTLAGAAMQQLTHGTLTGPNVAIDRTLTNPAGAGRVQLTLPGYAGATGQLVLLNTAMLKSVMNVKIVGNPAAPGAASTPNDGDSMLFSALECKLARDNPPSNSNTGSGGGSSGGGSSGGSGTRSGSGGGSSNQLPVRVVINEKIYFLDAIRPLPSRLSGPIHISETINVYDKPHTPVIIHLSDTVQIGDSAQ